MSLVNLMQFYLQAQCVPKKANYLYVYVIKLFYCVFKTEVIETEIYIILDLDYSTFRYVIMRHEDTGLIENQPLSGRQTVITNN